MKFLLPVGGIVDERFGILTSPSHKGIPVGIQNGMIWAADNNSFNNTFESDRFLSWLELMRPYKPTCLFVTVPDVLADAVATAKRYNEWSPKLEDWKLAYVAQDGMEELPDVDYDTLFIGGTTEYKLSKTVEKLIQKARDEGKHIHIGRVNYRKRYNHFALMEGSNEFTCDGTRNRFEGVERAIKSWSSYTAQSPLHRIISDSDSCG